MSESAAEAAERILRQLEDAWNEADGQAYAVPFADDAEFVNIRGEHHSGRVAIARGHQAIFDTVYKGSVNRYDTVLSKRLGDDALYVLAHATLSSPSGPLAGEHDARFSMVLTRQNGGDWQIAALHNTLVAPPPGPRPD
jgi:uncharacterized protein (TIGR02246 family)